MEAKGDSGQQTDAGVDRFDPRVAQAVLQSGRDGGPVIPDPTCDPYEGRQARAACPREPVLEQRDTRTERKPEDLAQLFLKQVGAVERPVDACDVRQLRRLARVRFSGFFRSA